MDCRLQTKEVEVQCTALRLPARCLYGWVLINAQLYLSSPLHALQNRLVAPTAHEMSAITEVLVGVLVLVLSLALVLVFVFICKCAWGESFCPLISKVSSQW